MISGYQHIDLSYLELIAEGDDEIKATMLEMLFEEPMMEIEKMERLAVDKNWTDLSKVSHKMKSTLSFVGNLELSDLNKEIEAAARGELERIGIDIKIERVKIIFGLSLQELKREYDKLVADK